MPPIVGQSCPGFDIEFAEGTSKLADWVGKDRNEENTEGSLMALSNAEAPSYSPLPASKQMPGSPQSPKQLVLTDASNKTVKVNQML